MKQLLIKVFFYLFLCIAYSMLHTSTVSAVVDPLSVPNNKFGIHIIQATHDESSPSASLVNSNGGDWGYITVLIEGKDKNKDKWQQFFDDLRRRHLIPLVRLATTPEGNFWKRPDIGEAQVWADFLDSLNWPTKNRYVIIYNEPNHAKEWGNKVDARDYAKVLDQTITTLKSKNGDFFVLNAGLDASAPQQPPSYQDEASFLQQMNEEVPGIFNKLDGWVSHSYPNPEFSGSPDGEGRITVRGYLWELQQLKSLGVAKNLPVFIAETGWKHAEGIVHDARFPSAETIAQYFKNAFENAWNHPSIVAVAPFLLSYQDYPFDHFSFTTPAKQYYPQFQTLMNMPKIAGKPVQDNLASLKKGEIYSSVVAGETYHILLSFKNTGQSIWGDSTTKPVRLVPLEGGKQLGIEAVELPKGIQIEPNQEGIFSFTIKAPLSGKFKVVLNLFSGDKQFDSKPVEFTSVVKPPVVLKIRSALKWKKEIAGSYLLTINGPTGQKVQTVNLNQDGISEEIEARTLLPDYPFEFSLEKPYYLPSKIRQKMVTGVNLLDFGDLQPDILTTLLNPSQLWRLLPWWK